MKNIIKKITSFFFILLGFTPLLFVLFITLKQQSIRRHMKQRMEERMLQTIILADGKIAWIKKGKEISVQGKMFDIKSMIHKDGMTTFQGLFDDEETLLNKNFTSGWEKHQTAQNQLLAQLFNSLQHIYFVAPAKPSIAADKQDHFLSFTSPALPEQFRTILTPPPQV
ncbi:MAG: hypothetical protein IPP43_03820 [Chitinophagaceae bacterium]|nr:hypothetical protein [Chitinophagaceae bacterium]MBL0130345.1 hypothetical protein [Chitinophagaceae bacterium]